MTTIFFPEQFREIRKYTPVLSSINDIASSNQINSIFLERCTDIWLRDFMPIQLGDKFIQYRYDPDYLREYPHLRTDPGPICDALGLETIKTDIILDGGNVILSDKILMMTDKVVLENKHQYSRKELIHKLLGLFEVEKVILIGWDRQDIYGHADGMLRFIDNRTLLLSDFYAEDPNVTSPLKEAGLDYEVLEFRKKNKSRRRWAYINFLQTPDILLLSKLNIPEDEMALEQIRNYFPEYAKEDRIHQVDCTSVVSKGGGLNCVSWEISTKGTGVNNQ